MFFRSPRWILWLVERRCGWRVGRAGAKVGFTGDEVVRSALPYAAPRSSFFSMKQGAWRRGPSAWSLELGEGE